MTAEVESAFDRDALLKGRAAATQDIKTYMRCPQDRAHVSAFLLSVPREELVATVFAKVCTGAIKRGFSEKKLASFIAGYADTMMAFARVI